MSSQHTVRAFGQELQRLANLIVEMGGVTQGQIDAAVRAVVQRDPDLARQVVEADKRIDDYQSQIEHETVRLLALRQPLGVDLREVLSALKISAALERTGDYVANTAKRAIALAQLPPVPVAATVPRLGGLARDQLRDVLDAFVHRDVEKAVAAWRRDQELDDLYSGFFRDVLAHMAENPGAITACTHLLFIAKNLERAGDHTTNIAETIHFLVTGHPLTEARPKKDTTSFTTGGAGTAT